MKSYLINAAKKRGLGEGIKVVALADGAKNCWSVLLALQSHCQSLECILDWFHIGKKFQNTQGGLGESLQKSLSSAKWKLWHGHVEKALANLNFIRDNLTEQAQQNKIQKLYNYLQENQEYLVNYDQKKQSRQPYTSQVAPISY